MKWLEVIELRSVGCDPELLELHLKKLMNEAEKETKKQRVSVYSREMIDTDFRIHLFHHSEIVQNSKSPLGLRLASALKTYGLVNHSIWIEMQHK